MSAERQTRWKAPELLAAVFLPTKWAVPGVVAEGLNLLAGAPKVGKSFLAYNLAVSVASGGKAFGRVDVDPGDVLYLALEDTPRRLQTRLRKMLNGAPAPARLDIATTSKPLTEGGGGQLRDWLHGHPDARLVIVDVFARIRGKAVPGSSAYANDYDPAAQLKAIADEFGVAILLLHHTRKAAADDYMDEVSGTQGLNGAADATLILKRSRGSADATLNVAGRDIEEASYAMRFAPDIGAWQMLDEPAGDYELGDTRHGVLRHLRAVGSSTPKAIADGLGLNLNTVKSTVTRMSRDGQLATDGRGSYSALPVAPDAPMQPATHATHATQDHAQGCTGGTSCTGCSGCTGCSCVCGEDVQDQMPPSPYISGESLDSRAGDDLSGPDIGRCVRCGDECRRYGPEADPFCPSCRATA